ncbi:MAG: tetratricopeptide repeat protein [Pseudomonadota bacterium]
MALAAAMLPAAAMADNYAAFARARVAAAKGDVSVAATQYGIALSEAPDSKVIALRAWREAMAAGDLPLARRAAAALARTGVAPPPDVALLAVADAVKANDPVQLKRALIDLSSGPLEFLSPVVGAWTSLGVAGDPAAALADTKQTGAIRRVITESRALLLVAQGRIDDGAAALQKELAGSAGLLDLRYAAAELFAGQGRWELAQKLVAGPNPWVVGFRAKIPAAKPTAAFGIARAFSRVAADLDDDRTAPIAVSLLRAALLLDPGDDRARILLASCLSRLNAHDHALSVLDRIAPGSAFAYPAAETRIELLRAKGDTKAALAAAKALSDVPDADVGALSVYGDLLADAGRFAEAAAAYSMARDRMSTASWQVWLQIGSAWERAGNWPDARSAFEKSVALGPNEPVALNAFGYALVEKGEDLPHAVEMLERASSLAPNQPSIADSLAWAYYRRGDVDKAIPLLETAALQSPGNAEIAEHLGDAYWTAGRRYEARYSWRAALVVGDAKAAPRLTAKLLDGLRPTS